MNSPMGRIGLWWMRCEICISPNASPKSQPPEKEKKNNNNIRGLGYLWFPSNVSLCHRFSPVVVKCLFDLAFKTNRLMCIIYCKLYGSK